MDWSYTESSIWIPRSSAPRSRTPTWPFSPKTAARRRVGARAHPLQSWWTVSMLTRHSFLFSILIIGLFKISNFHIWFEPSSKAWRSFYMYCSSTLTTFLSFFFMVEVGPSPPLVPRPTERRCECRNRGTHSPTRRGLLLRSRTRTHFPLLIMPHTIVLISIKHGDNKSWRRCC